MPYSHPHPFRLMPSAATHRVLQHRDQRSQSRRQNLPPGAQSGSVMICTLETDGSDGRRNHLGIKSQIFRFQHISTYFNHISTHQLTTDLQTVPGRA